MSRQAPRDRWQRSDSETESSRARPHASTRGGEHAESQSPDAWLTLQRAIQSRMGNSWLGRVQADGPQSSWDLQVLHLLQVARQTGLDVSAYLPWNAAPSWNQALTPYYRVLLHEQHTAVDAAGGVVPANFAGPTGESGLPTAVLSDGVFMDSHSHLASPDVSDILGAELMGELGLGGVTAVAADVGLDSVGLDAPVARAAAPGADPFTVHMTQMLERAGAGRSLTETEQSFMERVHGRRFPEIRLHEGPAAQAAAKAIAARAFTVGSDIYMGDPVGIDSAAGAELLAHEATHVKQAAEGRLPMPKGDGMDVSMPHQSYEKEAHAVGMAGRALHQLEVSTSDAGRPSHDDLGWFRARFGDSLSDKALDQVLGVEDPTFEKSSADELARQLITQQLVDQACSAWVAANSAMGALAATVNPAHASALGLLQQAVSVAFSQGISGAQSGHPQGLARLSGLVDVDTRALEARLPGDARVSPRALRGAMRSLLAGLGQAPPAVRVLGQDIDLSGVISGESLASVSAALVDSAATEATDLVDVTWAEASAKVQQESSAGAGVGDAWNLAGIYETVDPVGRAIVSSLQTALPDGLPRASDELVQGGLVDALQRKLGARAGQLQTELEDHLAERGTDGLDVEALSGLRGALSGLRAAAEVQLAPGPEVLTGLQALSGLPEVAELDQVQASFAPYPAMAVQVGAMALDHAPEAPLALGIGGGLETTGPALLGASDGASLAEGLGGGGEGPGIFRKARAGAPGPDVDDPAVDKALARRGGGRALPDGLRSALESHLGTDLSSVRIHVDATANAAARAVEAEAFATGQDIYFQDGRYEPGTTAGRELIAHEVAHTVQAADAPRSGSRVSDPGEAAEVEADRVAESFVEAPVVSELALGTELEVGAEIDGAQGEAVEAVEAVADAGVLHRKPDPKGKKQKASDKAKAAKDAVAEGEQKADKEGEPRELSEEEIEAEIEKAQNGGEEEGKEEGEGEEEGEEEEGKEEEGGEEETSEEGGEGGQGEGGGGPGQGDGGGGGAPSSPTTGGGSSKPVPFNEAQGGPVKPYVDEKAWHDQWKAGGSQTGVGAGTGTEMALEAMAAGGLEGGAQALSNIVVDTLLNKATKNIPYASGFIAMFDMANQGGPWNWLKGQFSNEAGTGIADTMGKGISGIANAEDWIDVLDGVINILDSVNKVIGLASTICMIVAAAGFIASFIFPALIPFVALAAKWGLLLGEISTLVGIGITAFRAISMLARAAQVAKGNADPATQIKRAEKLRAQTQQFTQEYATRKMNSARSKKQQKAADKKAGKSSGGKGGGGDTGKAKSGVTQKKTRKEKVLGALSTASKAVTGGDVVKQTKTVGAHAEHTKLATKTVLGKGPEGESKGERGQRQMSELQAHDTAMNEKHKDIGYHSKSVSDNSKKRADNHFAKQVSETKMQQAQAKHEAAKVKYAEAKSRLDTKQKDLDTAAAAERKARARYERAKHMRELTNKGHAKGIGESKAVAAARQEVANKSAARHAKAKVALEGQEQLLKAQRDQLARQKAEIDANPNSTDADRQDFDRRRMAVNEADMALHSTRHEVESLKIKADHDRNMVAIQQTHTEALQQPGREAAAELDDATTGLHQAQKNKAAAKDERDIAATGKTQKDQDSDSDTPGTHDNAQSQMEAAQKAWSGRKKAEDTHKANEENASGLQRIRDSATATKEAASDTRKGFKSGNRSENLDGSDVPADGYGHQGTGGVTGAGVDPAKGLMQKAADATGVSVVTNAVGAAKESALDFADVSADPAKDKDAAAAKAKFIEDSKARMDESFSSMTGDLTSPPTAQEALLDEQAGIYDARVAEVDRLNEQLQELQELQAENEAEKAALKTGQKVMQGMAETADQEKVTNEQKRGAQGDLRNKATEQQTQGQQAKDEQASQLGPVMGFVSGFARLMSIIPSRLMGGRGGGNAGSQIGEGVTQMGTGAEDSKAKAAEDLATAEEFAQQTDTADATADEVKSTNEGIGSEMEVDMQGAEQADADMSQAQSTATARVSAATGEKDAALSAWQGAVATMNGWASSHQAARTGGESNIDTTLDDVEKRLGEHQAAK